MAQVDIVIQGADIQTPEAADKMADALKIAAADGSFQTNLAAAGIPVAISSIAVRSATTTIPASATIVAEVLASPTPSPSASYQTEVKDGNSKLAIGLGVGLGVGIPAIVVLVAAIMLQARRKRGVVSPTDNGIRA